MAVKLKLNVQEIENHKFNNAPRGYDALEVDKFLDDVIRDYLLLENGDLVDKEELTKALLEIERLKKQNDALILEKSKLEAKIPDIRNKGINQDNLVLLKRIDALEKYLYKKGIDPKKIK